MQMSIYPACLRRTGSLGSLGRETNEALCDDEKVSLFCFAMAYNEDLQVQTPSFFRLQQLFYC